MVAHYGKVLQYYSPECSDPIISNKIFEETLACVKIKLLNCTCVTLAVKEVPALRLNIPQIDFYF